jgi:hypothetical protein
MTDVFDASVFEPREQRRSRPLPLATYSRYTSIHWDEDYKAPAALRVRGVKRLGLQYERRVQDVLSAIYGDAFVPSPAIRYVIPAKRSAPWRGVAIPDGILRLGPRVLIVEIKFAHTERVWGQLMERYLPLVRALEPQRCPLPVEICRTYDPDVTLPGSHTLLESLHQKWTGLGVIRWKI